MGKVFVIIDVILYIICACLFNLETAIYSMLFSFIVSMATDRLHAQNVKINALIFTNNYEVYDGRSFCWFIDIFTGRDFIICKWLDFHGNTIYTYDCHRYCYDV